MSDYFRIETGFWSGSEGRRVRLLGREAVVVRAYLRTCELASPFGLFYLPLPLLCHETGLAGEEADGALAALERAGVAFYDRNQEVVWVPAMALVNIDPITSDRDKRARWAEKELRALSRLPFYDRLEALFRREFHVKHGAPPSSPPPQPKPQGWGLDGASGGPASPFEGVAPNAGAQPLTPHPSISISPPAALSCSNKRKREFFDAAVRGLGLTSLRFNMGTLHQLDGILRHEPESPDEVESVARHYAASISPPAQPSWRPFCEKYDERRAQWQRSRRPAGRAAEKPKRTDRASSVPGMLYCEVHGGLYPAGEGCRGCRSEARP